MLEPRAQHRREVGARHRRAAARQRHRRGDGGQLLGKRARVQVHADADDEVVHAVDVGAHLRQDAGDLLAVELHVVRPLQRRRDVERHQRLGHRHARRPASAAARDAAAAAAAAPPTDTGSRPAASARRRPSRPRPLSCASATTTAPCGAGSAARAHAAASSFVEPTRARWRQARPSHAVVSRGRRRRQSARRAHRRADSRAAAPPSRRSRAA